MIKKKKKNVSWPWFYVEDSVIKGPEVETSWYANLFVQ